jgi:hypothetical protein
MADDDREDGRSNDDAADLSHGAPRLDPDRAAILARRQRFIALALSGLAGTVACDKPKPQPCLSPPATSAEGGEDPKTDPDPTADPQPCLKVAPTNPQPCLEVMPPEDPKADPQPCLKIAAPPEPKPQPCLSPPKPQPCLDVSPPEEPKPQPCLRMAPKPKPKPEPQPCLKIAPKKDG